MAQSQPPEALTYEAAGVNYGDMDPFKIMMQSVARTTAGALKERHTSELPWSRGESVFVCADGDDVIGLVEEGLGTKNLVADAMYKLNGHTKSYYDSIGQCTAAMIFNDLATLGIPVWCAAMHIAAGDSKWFKDDVRARDLANGFAKACQLAGATWGPGESSTLAGMIMPETVVLSGSAFGKTSRKNLLNPESIRDRDAIVLLASNGIHANALTSARKLVEEKRIPGYDTPISDGRAYGEALLDPTFIYSKVVEHCITVTRPERNPHYATHISGHGWRKLMRAQQPFEYVIDVLPEVPPVLQFIQQHAGLSNEQAYDTYNMGAGFALFMAEDCVQSVIDIAKQNGIHAFRAGTVKQNGKRRVNIKPLKLVFEGESLAVR